MGLELTLIPVDFEGPDYWSGESLLEIGKNHDLTDQMRPGGTFTEHEVPVPVHCHKKMMEDGGVMYGPATETPYGSGLTYVFVHQLLELKIDPENYWTKAAWAYLAVLEPDGKIVLYWS